MHSSVIVEAEVEAELVEAELVEAELAGCRPGLLVPGGRAGCCMTTSSSRTAGLQRSTETVSVVEPLSMVTTLSVCLITL